MDEKFRTLKATFLKCPNLGSLWGSCEFVAPLWWSTWGGGGVRTQDLLACAWYQKGITWKLGNFGFKDLRGERRLRYVFLLPPCVSMWNCMNWVSSPAPKSSFGEQPSSTSHYIVGQLVWKNASRRMSRHQAASKVAMSPKSLSPGIYSVYNSLALNMGWTYDLLQTNGIQQRW